MTALFVALMFMAGLASIAAAVFVAVQHWLETRRMEQARRQAVGP